MFLVFFLSLNKVFWHFSFMQLLRVVRARIRKLKGDDRSYTATVLLVGIPNVGKSAMVNSMHQIGRTGAEGAQDNSITTDIILVS